MTETDVHVMQAHFDAIEDAACAITDWCQYRMEGREGDAPETADQVITRAVPVAEHGDQLWHRCLTLAFDIAEERGDVRGGSHIDAMKAKRIYQALQEREGDTRDQIAARFGVTRAVVSDIKLGRSWSHVTGANAETKAAHRKASRNGHAKLTKAQIREVYDLAHAGELTQSTIGARYGVSGNNVGKIKRGESWADITGHWE